MRTLTVLALLAATATASADPRYGGDESWRYPSHSNPPYQQPLAQERYLERNKLADVRLDTYRRRAFIPLPSYGRSLDYIELRAGRTPFMLRDVVVRFADGTSLHTGSRGFVEPHEGRVVNLPPGRAPVVGLVLYYDAAGTYARGARLQVFGVPEYRRHWRSHL